MVFRNLILSAVLVLMPGVSVLAEALPVSKANNDQPVEKELNEPKAPQSLSPGSSYTGEMLIYIVEPASRYRTSTNVKYDNGVLDIPIQTEFTVDDGQIWGKTMIWNAPAAGIAKILSDNIKAVAAVFNPADILTASDPPSGGWFYAHFNDAATSALPGEIGRHVTSPPNFTHTVLIEEGTTTW